MRLAVFVFYIAFQIIYLGFADYITIGVRWWYGFNILTHISFVGFLCYLLEGYDKLSEDERLLMKYIKYLSFANCLYLIYCLIVNDWVKIIGNTDVFAMVLAVGFVVFLFHRSLRK